jgi:hypothetical protein
MNGWDVFWFLFLFLPLAIMWGLVLVDLMGRHDLVGWQKALWVAVIVFFPWIGILAYLIVRPRSASAGYVRGGTGAPAATYMPSGYPTPGAPPATADTPVPTP